MQRPSKITIITAVFAAAWLGTLVAGLRTLITYETKAGAPGAAPQGWPENSKLTHSRETKTLVMLAHPHCPCTRASMGELARIMAQVQGRATAYVLFLKPENAGPDWDDTDLRRSAQQIPGVKVIDDVEGAEALRFGAETSGHTFLFSPDGKLLFSGGITQSRGHAGGNAGESAIISLVNTGTAERKSTFVFGCSLVEQTKEGD